MKPGQPSERGNLPLLKRYSTRYLQLQPRLRHCKHAEAAASACQPGASPVLRLH